MLKATVTKTQKITNTPQAWTVGIDVAGRSWGYYYNPARGRQPPQKLPQVPGLLDGSTGWTVTGPNFKIVRP